MKDSESNDDNASEASAIKLPKMMIIDTNVSLSDTNSPYNFQENDIVYPIQSIEEIDKFKKGLETINYNARHFLGILGKLVGDKIFNGGVPLGEGLGKLSIAMAREWDPVIEKNLRGKTVDNEIINLAYCLTKEHPERQVIIVSKDMHLLLMAKALGILAQDYLHEPTVDLSILSSEVEEIDVESSLIDELKKHKSSKSHQMKKDAIPNQNYVLKNGNRTCLVADKDGRLILLEDKDNKPFGIEAKNKEQVFALNVLLDPEITIVTIEGVSGSGKTLLALAAGLQQLEDKLYNKLYYTRDPIPMGEKMGFLPGDLEAKLDPYMEGYDDNIEIITEADYNNSSKITKFESDKKLLIKPLIGMRGASIRKVFYIIDEAQNLKPKFVKTIATRAGIGTKMIFTGDTSQIDNPEVNEISNGFTYLIQKFRGQKCHAHIHLIESERSELAALAAKLL